MSTRVLFLNTRDQCGADVAVHLTLMANFAPEEAEVFVLSNSEAGDADDMRESFSRMPHVRAEFLSFGRPAEALKGKAGAALAYGVSAASLAKAAAFVRRHRVEIVHATDRPRDASFVALLGRMSGAASVVHMHSNPGPHLSRPTLWGFRNATALFGVSEFVRRGLCEMGFPPERVHTVHNAVDACHFDPDRAPGTSAAVRRRFGIPEGAPLAGIIARLNPWKGQRELIGGVARLRESHPDLHVLVVGAPVAEEQADYENRAREGGIADRVHFAGFHKDVRPLLEAFDLFVHPSYEEPFGLAIAEAMAMRKPVIACRSGGVPEIITHGEDGWLVEPRSAESVADGVAALLNDPERGRRLGARARQTVCARFTPRRQCALVAQRYGELLSTRG